MPTGTVIFKPALGWHLVGTVFLNHFFFFFPAKGVKAWNGMHVRQPMGARNQPLPLPIDPLTPSSSMNTTIVFKARGLESVEKN